MFQGGKRTSMKIKNIAQQLMYRLVRFIYRVRDVPQTQKDTVHFTGSDFILGVAVI